MYSFDASSIIYAWDNYPPNNQHFDKLWDWVAEEIKNKKFCISKIALDEVSKKTSKCGLWLKDNGIEVFPLTPSILLRANEIKTLLGVEEQYGKGVGENDLFIIATSKEIRATLVTEERKQKDLPAKKPNYKIPAVCGMEDVDVKCFCFLDLLKIK